MCAPPPFNRLTQHINPVRRKIFGHGAAATEADLITKNLPAEILARHHAAVADYQAKQTEFKQKLKALEDADDSGDEARRGNAVQDLAAFMEQNQKSRTHTPADPDNLPFGTPSGKVRPPVETEQGFKTGLFKAKPAHLAANGSLSGITLPGTALPSQPARRRSGRDRRHRPDPGDPSPGRCLLRI